MGNAAPARLWRPTNTAALICVSTDFHAFGVDAGASRAIPVSGAPPAGAGGAMQPRAQASVAEISCRLARAGAPMATLRKPLP